MLPLENVKVIELGINFAGPYCAAILAHLGAEVIKVERPGSGDDARGWGPPFLDGAGASFHAVNLNKKSITIDLKSAADRERLLDLVAGADVFIQNLRPGVVESLGLDGETLTQKFPELVYCSLNAYGHDGPLKDRPGYEPIVQAFSGLMMVSGVEEGPATRIGTQVLDNGTGMWSAIGVLAALWQRQATGKGSIVGTSLLETAIGWLTVPQASYSANGQRPERHPTGSPRVVPFEAMPTSDGEMLVAAANDRLFAKLSTALGHPEWAEDPRFLTNADRVANKTAILTEIGNVMRQKPRQHWEATLDQAGVPNAPINTFDETLRHPHVQELGILHRSPNLDEPVDFVGLPITFNGERPQVRSGAPKHGAHQDEILGPERTNQVVAGDD